MPVVKKERKRFLNDGKIKLGFLMALLVVILPVLLLAARQTTEDRQHASFDNLNTGDQIMTTLNADGTMGPADWTGNFSNTLNASRLGTLTLLVTDPSQDQRPTWVGQGNPNNGHQPPSQAEANGWDNNHNITGVPSVTHIASSGSPTGDEVIHGGPVAVSSLLLTTPKVEVHMAYAGTPGDGNATPSGKPSDRWEVLNIGSPKTFDLVQLAKGNLATLGITNLAAGRYTEIRMYISTASATLSDGTPISLTIPGRSNIVRVNQPFTVITGVNTNLTMAFDAQNSVIKAEDQYLLKPVVASMVETKSTLPTGVTTVSVSPSVAPGCHYQVCTIACPVNNPDCCPHILICPSGSPTVTCTPRPECHGEDPGCLGNQPNMNWCPPTIMPTGIVSGGPSAAISPAPTLACIPRPSCLDATPKCELPMPTQGWCPPQQGNLSQLQIGALLEYLNTLLRNFISGQH